MKKQLILFSAFSALTIFGSSCKKGCMDESATNYSMDSKKDNGSCVYAPEITLKGQSSLTLVLGENYVELGATAINNDGSSVDVIIDNSDVNTNVPGTYMVTYTAENENGTAVAERTVNVVVNQSIYLADWTCASDCGTTQLPVDGNRTIIAGDVTSEFKIDGAFTILGGQIVCQFSGNSITVPSQDIPVTGGTITVSGTGSLAVGGGSFIINYDYVNTIPFAGGTGSCTATYTKQ